MVHLFFLFFFSNNDFDIISKLIGIESLENYINQFLRGFKSPFKVLDIGDVITVRLKITCIRHSTKASLSD